MMKKLVCIATFLMASAVAFAGDAETAAVAKLKVDLDAVVEAGKVEPVDGITSAGQPDEAGFKVFADSGYIAVIDLRTEGEDRGVEDEPALVEGLGMEYVNFPIGRGDITIEKANELNRLLEQYDEPVLVHCGSANRVGALLALQHYDENGDLEKALEVGREGGMTRLEDAVKKELGVE